MLTTENTLTLVIDFQDRMIPSISNNEEIVRKTAIFIEGCRILGVHIITTQQYTKGLGETIPQLKTALGDFKHVEKITFSCYGCEEFEAMLDEADKRCIFITGVESHICVQQTVLDLLEDDYAVYVLADCIGSRFENDFQYAIRRMEQAGAIITTAESALFEMMVRADHPKRKEVSNLVK